ncbi:MAG: flagellar motor switch protein FliN [Deltaproteobacteria bacterium]|nr:flagellar motor switch protein FliN [Deltaproteobacteria bacterium]
MDDISWDDVSEDTDAGKTAATVAEQPAKKQAEFSELKKGNIAGAPGNLDFILDIPLQVTVELGRSSMPIYDLLQLGQGSIVELNKLAGEPLEVLVNQKLIARGEVVVVNEKFGIRLTDVVSTTERIENLG